MKNGVQYRRKKSILYTIDFMEIIFYYAKINFVATKDIIDKIRNLLLENV